MSANPKPSENKNDSREDRVAKALRENLRKRKQQAQIRQTKDKDKT